MQASDPVLAWRYGKALFAAAQAQGDVSSLPRELGLAQEIIRDFLDVIKNPGVPAADKKNQLRQALRQKISPLALRFLELLIEKKRFDLLPGISLNVGRLLAEKNNTGRAKVWSAKPLSAEEKKEIRRHLEVFFKKTIELETKEDSEIIGGLVVRLGDWVLDSSLRNQLRSMRETLNGN